MYSCEIWGKCAKIENGIATFGNSGWERFHSRICKNIIGAHKRAFNTATLAEMGTYPVSIEINRRMIRYLLRYKTIQKDRLVYKAFIEQQKVKNTTNTWVTKAREILDKNWYSYIFKSLTDEGETDINAKIIL